MIPKQRTWRRAVLGCAVFGLAAGLSAFAAAQEREVRAVNWGGAMMDAHLALFYGPFTKATGIKVVADTWSGKISQIRAMVEAKSISKDMFVVNPWDAVQGCDEGILERIDPKKDLGLSDADVKDFYEGAIEPCGVATDIWTYVWSWDRARHPEWTEATGPKNIKDIYDVKKWPGKRGIGKRAYMNLEMALQADGVSNKDMYKVLATEEGVKRAFAKFDQIKPHAVWWTATPQQAQFLADGVSDLQHIVGARWFDAKVNHKKDFVPMWYGQMYSYNMWSVAKGTPRRQESMDLLKFMLKPDGLAKQAEMVAYAPARKSALKLVKAELQPQMPTAHFGDDTLYLSAQFWTERLDAYTKRFEAWLGK